MDPDDSETKWYTHIILFLPIALFVMKPRLTEYLEKHFFGSPEETTNNDDENTIPSAQATLALIKSRRSIFPKDYDGTCPPMEHVEMMLEAANWAPTHGKTEPWTFCVLSKGEATEKHAEIVRNAMVTRLGGEVSEKFKAFEQKQARKAKDKAKVAYLIGIGMRRQALEEKVMPEWEEQCAVACAVQNLHLMATSLGVAGYWSSGGPLDDPDLLAFLGLDHGAGDKCLGFFHVGMAPPEKVQAYRAKRRDIKDKVCYL